MPALKTYDLFVSHAWRYNDDYYRLVKLLEDASNFYMRNYSVPKHDPAIDPNTQAGKARLKAALEAQIRPVNCVLILAGMYAHHSDWVQTEIVISQGFNKPMIGVVPWGQERTPAAVQNSVKEMVNWNTSSIVDAVRRHAL